VRSTSKESFDERDGGWLVVERGSDELGRKEAAPAASISRSTGTDLSEVWEVRA